MSINHKIPKSVIVVVIISSILLSNITPVLPIRQFGTEDIAEAVDFKQISSDNPYIDNFLYEKEITQSKYVFEAKDECYLIAEIEGIDFTVLDFDGQIFELSYGLNVFPMEFGNNFEIHFLNIGFENLEYFKSLSVQPLIISEGFIETELFYDSVLNFHASGMISILTRPEFAYNWLYAELRNESGDSTIIKSMYNTTDYPEIDSRLYALFIEQGTYVRFDITVDPGEYNLIFRGNGTMEFKIIVNSDWDLDLIDDVDEIQQEGVYEFTLDPKVPDTWGFFEKSDENLIYTEIDGDLFSEGYFTFFIPEIYSSNQLVIRVNSGTFKNIVVDDDSIFFEDTVLTSDRYSPSDWELYGEIESGWHSIAYNSKSNITSEIEFVINGKPIKVLNLPEMVDTDGDGLKDLEELPNGLRSDNVDTDNDGIRDNVDSSPLSEITLNKERIYQMILSTDKNKNTVIDLQIKKPTTDYSTNGVPRLWRNEFNVSIYPVLRMFGSKYTDMDNDEFDMNKNKLAELWGKQVQLIYESDDSFDENGIGDPLPNPKDPNSEFFFIFPKPSETSFSYSIQVPKGHASKNDNYLDLRFDFIWLITHYDAEDKSTSLLHYYNFTENINVQSMTMREIGDVEYILGSPDSFIENQILWALTQNPTLGNPEDFNLDVNDDVICKGNINYFDLPDRIIQERANNPLGDKETEVLYIAGLFNNRDILNEIELKNNPNPNFALKYQGNYEAYFSLYSISNIYEDTKYFFGDPEVMGETKILYQISHSNFSLYEQQVIEKRTNIAGIPIAMEVLVDSKVLKISQAQGTEIPLDQIPWNPDQLNDRISVLHEIYIEQEDSNMGIPLLNFKEGSDIYKGYLDNRQQEVELTKEFFTPQPQIPAELFMNLISEFHLKIDLIEDHIYSLINFTESALLPIERLDLLKIENILLKVNNFKSQLSSQIGDFMLFYEFSREINQDFSNLMDYYNNIDGDYHIPADWTGDGGGLDSSVIFADLTKNLYTIFMDIGDDFILKLKNNWDLRRNWGVQSQEMANSQIKEVKFSQKSLKRAGAISVVIGVVIVAFAIVELIQLHEGYQGSSGVFAARIIGSVCNLILGVVIIIHGIVQIIIAFKTVLIDSLRTISKSFGYIALALAVVVVLWDWVSHIIKWDAEGLGYSFEGEIAQLCFTTFVVGFGIALGLASTGVGILFAGIMAAFFLVTSFLDFNEPSMKIRNSTYGNTGIFIPEETKLNLRRHGSLEIGDHIGFKLIIQNDGMNPLWIRARFKTFGENWDSGYNSRTWRSNGWIANGYVGWKGRWGMGDYIYWNYDDYFKEWKEYGGYYVSGFWPMELYEERFSSKITGATPNLHFNLELEMDWESCQFILFGFKYDRETGNRLTGANAIKEDLDMPVLENSINDFYSHTSEYWSTESKRNKFYAALDEYRYYDAYKSANDVVLAVETQTGIKYNNYNALKSRWVPGIWWLSDYYILKTYSESEFQNMIFTYFGLGFRALGPKTGLTGWFAFYYSHFLGYASSDGNILIPKTWVDSTSIEFTGIPEIIQLRDSLPIKTNIKTDLRDNIIEMNVFTGEVDVDLTLYLEGYLSDKQKVVTFYITAPENFSITPNTEFTTPLLSTLNFKIIRNTTELKIGVHFFDLKILLDSEVIYEESVPFRIKPYSFVELETYTPTEPIIPGENFLAIKVINSGSHPEIINFTVTGIPYSFINKNLYPESFMSDNQQIFSLNPEEEMQAFIINPPRYFTTSPGIYEYNISVIDAAYNNFNISYNGNFEVAEFYDLEFKCLEPEITIFDYQIANFTFNITNWGNVGQNFNISYDEISLADSFLSINAIYLEPGESQLFNLSLDPLTWGNQEFLIIISSEYNSSELFANITIIDDDTTPPIFANFEVINTPIEVTINFSVLNEIEGDDYGLSNLKIFIDNELLLDQILDPTKTVFSFTFNDTHGGWFMEYGTHDIRIDIIDNDFDVPNDTLNSSYSYQFNTTLEDIHIYIDWQLEVLKEYIDSNLYSRLSWLWNKKINCAQKQLNKAFEYVDDGRIVCSLFHDAIAKVMLQVVEFRTEIFEKLNLIDENVAEYIVVLTHIIRNNIVLLMGFIPGTEIGHQIALIEIKLLNLKDFIDDEINWWRGMFLKNHIRYAINKLESALFKISLGIDIEWSLKQAIKKLDKALDDTNHLLRKGIISQELADIIQEELSKANADIGKLIDFSLPQ